MSYDLLEGNNRRSPVVFDDLPHIVTVKPFGAENNEDQWDIISETDMVYPETKPPKPLSVSIINFSNRSASFFSKQKNGKLLIGIVTKDQTIGE